MPSMTQDQAMLHGCETYLRERGYTILPPKHKRSTPGGHAIDKFLAWVQTLPNALRSDLHPLAQVMDDRMRMKSEKRKLPSETRQLKPATHDQFMEFVSNHPELLALLEGILFRTCDAPNLKHILGRPNFPHDWQAINSTQINCAINMDNHVRKCMSRVRKGNNPDANTHEWTAHNFTQRALLPLPPMDHDRQPPEARRPIESSGDDRKLWLLEDTFSDATCVSMSSKWNACGMQSLEGDGVFVWSAAETKDPQWRLSVGSTYAVAFDHTIHNSGPSSALLLTGGTDDLRLWEISEKSPPRSQSFGNTVTWSLDWAWFGSYFCSGHHMKACVSSVYKNVPLRVFPAKECGIDERAHIDVCRFHPTTNYVGVAGDGAAAMWDIRAARVVRTWLQPKHFGRITCMTFSEDGILMAIGSDAGYMARMDLRAGQPLKHGETFNGPIWALGYDGTDLLAGGDFGLSRRSKRPEVNVSRQSSRENSRDISRRNEPYNTGRARRSEGNRRDSLHNGGVPTSEETILTDAQIIGVTAQRDGSLRWGGKVVEP